MTAVGRGRCSTDGTGGCSSKFCPQHGERNRAVFTPRVVYMAPEQAAPTSGRMGVVPLAPTRGRSPGRGASFVLGLAVTAAAILMALGVVHLVELLGGGR